MGKNALYELLASGKLKASVMEGCGRIPKQAVEEFIRRQANLQ